MDPISEAEASDVRAILERLYGPTASTWNINYAVYEVLGRLITSSGQCTKAMHLVPRPWDLSSPLKWAQREVRLAIVRYLKTGEGQYYVTCMKAAALRMRSDFELAAMGL